FCDPGGCLNEPVQAIAILLLARLLISNAAELGYPLLKSIVKEELQNQFSCCRICTADSKKYLAAVHSQVLSSGEVLNTELDGDFRSLRLPQFSSV
ncbi:unnamed protein product, partial [Soboliphyme baturini]|uniref:Brefeldin A-inhibited guanine nucleotide-exchange protein 3 n=1 Tax=Soboliphyme baturini TaxID=241478 RepID=A0A183IND8_9BILA